ncbi:MAG: DUF61 family protein [Acidilobaceae archaeon]
MSEPGDIVDKLFKAELRYVNKHLPVARRSLEELLSDPLPCVLLRDGGKHCFKRRELEKLAGQLSPEDRRRLLLPIIIQARRGEREPQFVVEGLLEAIVVETLLGQSLGARERGFLTLYPLQVQELLSRYPTLFQTTVAPPASEIVEEDFGEVSRYA